MSVGKDVIKARGVRKIVGTVAGVIAIAAIGEAKNQY
jgi:hypothetical protein